MDTELKTGKVRLVVSGSDQHLVQAVLSRFVQWWDASGHKDLVASNDIVPLPDVTWNANVASITLPVYFESPITSHPPTSFEIISLLPSEVDGRVESTREPTLSIEPYELAGVVGSPRPMDQADDRVRAQDRTFQIVGDASDATLMQFPSEAEAARQGAEIAHVRAVIRTRRRRAGLVARGWPRRAETAFVLVLTTLLRTLTLPWSLAVLAVKGCHQFARRAIRWAGAVTAAAAVVVVRGAWRVVTLPWRFAVMVVNASHRAAARVFPRIGAVTAAAAVVVVRGAWRVVTLPWRFAVMVASASYRAASRGLPRVGAATAAAAAVIARGAWRVVTLPWLFAVMVAEASHRAVSRALPRIGRAVAVAMTFCVMIPWRILTSLLSMTARTALRSSDAARRMVLRASRRVAAIGTACGTTVWRVITVLWSSSALAMKASGDTGRRLLQRVARGSASIVAPRMIVRAAVVSAMLSVVIAASVARPSRIVNVVRASVTSRPAPPPAIAANRVEPAPLPSRSLAMFTAPARMSRVRVVASRPAATTPVRITKVTTRKKETKPIPAVAQIASVNQEYVGSLLVMSEPSGATVRIDGQTVGTTPLQLDRVRVGSHAVHVALDGYPVWSTAATVVYGKSNGVLARLGR